MVNQVAVLTACSGQAGRLENELGANVYAIGGVEKFEVEDQGAESEPETYDGPVSGWDNDNMSDEYEERGERETEEVEAETYVVNYDRMLNGWDEDAGGFQ